MSEHTPGQAQAALVQQHVDRLKRWPINHHSEPFIVGYTAGLDDLRDALAAVAPQPAQDALVQRLQEENALLRRSLDMLVKQPCAGCAEKDRSHSAYQAMHSFTLQTLVEYESRCAALREALMAAAQFLPADVERGPSSFGWANTCNMVRAALQSQPAVEP